MISYLAMACIDVIASAVFIGNVLDAFDSMNAYRRQQFTKRLFEVIDK